jgi:MFS family permease
MGLNGLLIMCIELPLSHWLRRFPHRRVLVLGYAIVGLGCASFAFARTMPEFFLAMTLFTAGEMLSIPIASGYGAQLAPIAYRGRYSGFQAMVWSLAGFAGSAGVWFYDRLGFVWWLYMGVVGLLAGVAMTFRVRDRRAVVATMQAPFS